MESFKEILKKLDQNQYDVIETWLYNSKDEDLEQALKLINSSESLNFRDHKILRKYQTFIKLLLQGQLVCPPSQQTDPDPAKLRNVTISCNLFIFSIDKLLKNLIYSKIFSLFSVIFIKSLKNPNTELSKVLTFTRKLEKVDFCMSMKLKNLKKVIFSKLSFKSRQIRLKKKKKSAEEVKNFAVNCVWIMILKGKILNEQLGLWKWKAGQTGQKSKIQNFFKVFWTRQSRIINLLRMIGINCNTRTLEVIKKHFFHWREVQEELKFIDFREMEVETTLKNFKKLLKFKVFNQLNIFFQLLKTKSRKMRSKHEKLLFKKSVLFNISKIFQKQLKKTLIVWKSRPKPLKTKTIVEITHLGSMKKPLIVPENSQKLTSSQKSSLRGLSFMILLKLQHFWLVWAREKRFLQETTFSSNETTMDLSNFILPAEKCAKLRLIINHLFNIIIYKRNLKYLVFNNWIHEGQKRSLTILNIQQIINKQNMKTKAKRKAFAELVLASQYPLTFTDIE